MVKTPAAATDMVPRADYERAVRQCEAWEHEWQRESSRVWCRIGEIGAMLKHIKEQLDALESEPAPRPKRRRKADPRGDNVIRFPGSK